MKTALTSQKKNIVIKKVAMLGDEPFFWTTCAKRFFKIILNTMNGQKIVKIIRLN